MRPRHYGAKVKCLKCGTILQSKHVHDFTTCECWLKKRGKYGLALDGGPYYLKMSVRSGTPYEVIHPGCYVGDEPAAGGIMGEDPPAYGK